MSWLAIDCHAHTTMSDGALSVGELLEATRERGVRASVSDHISGDVRGAVATVDGVRAYLDELDRHEVARGGEFCWHDPLWRELPEDLLARFTHRIGSLHAVFLPGVQQPVGMWSAVVPGGISAESYMGIHLDNLERMMAEMSVDIFAHPTLLPLPLRVIPPEELWTDALEERAVSAIARAGIAFELSNRYRVHERLVRRAHERGVRFALGSDGHTREQVGDVAFPLALARHVGVHDEELFDPWLHGERFQRAS